MSSFLVKNVFKRYQNFEALSDVSFSGERGQVVGLLGKNGAGKTTIFKIMNGIIYSNSGSVSLFDMPIDPYSFQAKSKIGYLSENAPVYGYMRVCEFLEFMHSVRDSLSDFKQRLNYCLNALDLCSKKDSIISTLSKGNKQRVALCGALIHDPDVLILDEALIGLDAQQVSFLRILIRKLRDEGKIIFFSDHTLSEVENICDKVVIIENGKVIFDDHRHNLYSSSNILTTVLFNNDRKTVRDAFKNFIYKPISFEDFKNGVKVVFSTKEDIRPKISSIISKKNLFVLEMSNKTKTLEEFFLGMSNVDGGGI